ncbi:hypothetical protein K9N68_24370 [Kovacikia minuta CCNUW1]|uniref:bestrophin family protein n=1 Tax=Kovacikia minuta TaxID=2931930 RepID=UPI001CCBA1AC|nr:bestrophin family ion channel [Kovacikia minuta]UBF24771.1 hypothetical protein K9N68_24370 [Kovacikia minuta CCNUW1]
MATAKPNWFQMALTVRGSVLPIILPRIFLFGCIGVLVSLAHASGLLFYSDTLGDLTNNVACNLVLGLLLVFRTNTAYERFWEGRKAWGTLVVNIRNLAREIQVGVMEPDEVARVEKRAALNWLGAFVIATKLHLRNQPIADQLDSLTEPEVRSVLSQSKNSPLDLLLFVSDYLQQQSQKQRLDSSQRYILTELLNNLVEGLTSCERIASTPMPIAYSIYLKRLIMIYCGLLPFSLVEGLNWWTGAVVALISFVLLGVEAIGNEIEDPFGTDPNDLPLDEICNAVLDTIESAKQFALGSSQTVLLEKNSLPNNYPSAKIEMHHSSPPQKIQEA